MSGLLKVPGPTQQVRRRAGTPLPTARRLRLISACVVGVLALSGSSEPSRTSGTSVDLALVLGVDVSNSVNWFEYQLQRHGLARAIRDPEVVDAIRRGRLGRIAVAVVQWSGDRSQRTAVPWRVLDDRASAERLSRTIAFMPREFGGHATNISGMIAHGTRLLQGLNFAAGRKVIDVSGDGRENVSPDPAAARDRAIASGITINGLAIENEEPDLRSHYRDFIIGGPGAFVIRVKRYEDFSTAMKKKLIREISPKYLSRLRR